MRQALQRVVPYERAGLSLYDPDHDGLKIVSIYGRHEGSIFRVGHLVNRRMTQTGWVFEHKTKPRLGERTQVSGRSKLWMKVTTLSVLFH